MLMLSYLQETQFFFPEFNKEHFYKEEEIYFRNREVQIDEENFIHKIIR